MNWSLGIGAALVTISLFGCSLPSGDGENYSNTTESRPDLSGTKLATFAGGCFWCIEADFEAVPGVVEAVSGYTGGTRPDPSYSEVSSGRTNHVEAVQVYYDPAIIAYEGLLQAFWRMIDPTDAGGQFSDRGQEYTTAIFVHDEEQRLAAERSIAELVASGRHDGPLVTPIRPALTFYAAEDYHQDYHRRNGLRYRFYRHHSGRDRYLDNVWGDALRVDFSRFSPAVPQGSIAPTNPDRASG